jgi:arginase family enzyme
MSRLRARCPDCGTFTAVALGPGYECHACGREFAAGMVRVPRAWGDSSGQMMAEAARLPFPYPEAAVVEEDTLGDQTLAVAAELPERPLVLGGCCCSHIGAVEALAAHHGRIAIVWFDAHGDLNTPETSPSGNLWGMPLRIILDSGAVDPRDVLLLGARNLDPPEVELIASIGLRTDAEELDAALEGTEGVYVALDADALDPAGISSFMPEPGGFSLAETEEHLRAIAERATVLGAGLSGLAPEVANVEPSTRLVGALGL